MCDRFQCLPYCDCFSQWGTAAAARYCQRIVSGFFESPFYPYRMFQIDLPDRMPDRMSEDMPEDMPDRVPEDMPEQIAEDMPARMPEDIPDRMPESARRYAR